MSEALITAMTLASFGLLASRSPWRSAFLSTLIVALVCVAVGFAIDAPTAWAPFLNGLALAIIALCACAVLGGLFLGARQAVVAAIVCGVASGLLVNGAQPASAWLIAAAPFPVTLLGHGAAARGWSMALKATASWLLAIVILSAALAFVGPAPSPMDHME